jgi:hypothetical protein
MVDASEVVRKVGINDFRVASVQQPFDLDHRVLVISPGTVPVLFGWKVGFEDRLQHQHCCCHADPIPHRRDAQSRAIAMGRRVALWAFAKTSTISALPIARWRTLPKKMVTTRRFANELDESACNDIGPERETFMSRKRACEADPHHEPPYSGSQDQSPFRFA